MCFSNILFHLVEEQSFMVLRPSNIVEQYLIAIFAIFDCTHLGNLFIAGQRESARHLLQFATARLYFTLQLERCRIITAIIVIIIVYIVGIIVVITITMIRTIMKENHLLA